MKLKRIYGLIVLIIASAGVICLSSYPRQLSPQALVTLYYEYFEQNDAVKMNSLWVESRRNTEVKEEKYLETLKYFKLHSCYESRVLERDVAYMAARGYSDPDHIAKVYATFETEFYDVPGSRGGFDDLIYIWIVYLARQDKYSPWEIVDMGA